MALAALLGIAALGAVIMGVVDWTNGRRDRRALYGVAAIMFTLGAIGTANAWPATAMGFVTAEPVATQAATSIALGLVRSLFVALLFGLAAGVGAWAAARQAPGALAVSMPAWLAGLAAACFAAGVGAVAEQFVPASVPRWPTFGVEVLALPSLGAMLAGARVLATIGLGLFVLHWLARLTSGWRRRGWVAAIAVIAVVAASGLVGASDAPAAALAGALSGAAVVVAVYGLLRFDPLAVPAYLATGAALDFAASALRKGYPTAYANAAIAIAVAVVVAWAVTRYLAQRRAEAAGPAA
jgi:hypothetical protein